jgi:hypothetical protein
MLRDLARVAGGTPKDKNFAHFVAGKDSLSITCEVEANTISAKCSEVLTAYSKTTYRAEYSWIDNMRVVVERDVIEKLEERIFAALNDLRVGKNSDTRWQGGGQKAPLLRWWSVRSRRQARDRARSAQSQRRCPESCAVPASGLHPLASASAPGSRISDDGHSSSDEQPTQISIAPALRSRRGAPCHPSNAAWEQARSRPPSCVRTRMLSNHPPRQPRQWQRSHVMSKGLRSLLTSKYRP